MKCSIISVDVNTAWKASAFLSLKQTALLRLISCWTGDRCDLPDEPHVVISSDPLKRYPDWYRGIFHMLPICYKKPDSSQVNRMQSGGRGHEFWLHFNRRKKKDLMALWLQETHCHFLLSKHKAINKHVLYKGGCHSLSIMLLGFCSTKDKEGLWAIWYSPRTRIISSLCISYTHTSISVTCTHTGFFVDRIVYSCYAV